MQLYLKSILKLDDSEEFLSCRVLGQHFTVLVVHEKKTFSYIVA